MPQDLPKHIRNFQSCYHKDKIKHVHVVGNIFVQNVKNQFKIMIFRRFLSIVMDILSNAFMEICGSKSHMLSIYFY